MSATTTLKEFFSKNPRAALAFSGGVDSSYLLYAAHSCGADVHAYFAKTPFQPEFELEDAKRLASEVGAELTVLKFDILTDAAVVANPPDRCYYCKKRIFGILSEAAKRDGYTLIIDGTNASDDAGDRPGMRALREIGVRSPLRECGLTKSDIRVLSKEAGLFTWGKPAYACLATRIPAGTAIDHDTLQRVESAESELFAMGFTDFRVRVFHDAARLQLPENQLNDAVARRGEVRERLKKYFDIVLLDTEVR